MPAVAVQAAEVQSRWLNERPSSRQMEAADGGSRWRLRMNTFWLSLAIPGAGGRRKSNTTRRRWRLQTEAADEHLLAEFAESGVEAVEHDEGIRDRVVGTGGCLPYVMLLLPPRYRCLSLAILGVLVASAVFTLL